MNRYEMILSSYYGREVEVENFEQAQALVKIQEVMQLLLNLSDSELAQLKVIDPTREIAHVWGIEDITSNRPELTEAQALRVLKRIDEHIDSTLGITWDTLDDTANTMYPDLSDSLDSDGLLTISSFDYDFALTPSAFYQILDELEDEDDFLDTYTWDATSNWHNWLAGREGVTIIPSKKDTSEEE